MPARRSVLVLLTVMFLIVPVLAGQAEAVPDADAVSRPVDGGGLIAWLVEFARGLFSTRPPAGSAGEDDGDGAFARNPCVYVAAFWGEIVNAPGEMSFFERIMAFLEAVRVRRR